MNAEFPILEFDQDRNALIRPGDILQAVDIAENCVLCFFSDAIETLLAKTPHKQAASFRCESFQLPVYELNYKGRRVALIQACVGAPLAAAQIEELTAFGCRKFIACGSCGVSQKDIAVGHLVIPVAAVRDEGTSYHYIEPSREIAADKRIVRVLEETLAEKNISYIKAKTWTTDAFYRETPLKIQKRKDEGCVTVEMEAAAYMAVAKYNRVEFGQILYAGDNLGGEVWDSRGFNSRTEIREFVLQLALDACIKM